MELNKSWREMFTEERTRTLEWEQLARDWQDQALKWKNLSEGWRNLYEIRSQRGQDDVEGC